MARPRPDGLVGTCAGVTSVTASASCACLCAPCPASWRKFMYASLTAVAQRCADTGSPVVHEIASTFAPDGTAIEMCDASWSGVMPAAFAARLSTTPDDATCFSVTVFTSVGVLPGIAAASTSTFAVEVYWTARRPLTAHAPITHASVQITIHRPYLRITLMDHAPNPSVTVRPLRRRRGPDAPIPLSSSR